MYGYRNEIEYYQKREAEIKNMIMSDGLAYPVNTDIMSIIKNLVKQRDTLSNIEYALARIAISGDTALDKISNLEQTCIKHVQNNVQCAVALSRVGFKTDTSIMDNNILEGIEWLKAHYHQNKEAWAEMEIVGVHAQSLADGIKFMYKSFTDLRDTYGTKEADEIEVKGLKEELSHKQRTIEAFIALIDKL
jgi:hypothetical protein